MEDFGKHRVSDRAATAIFSIDLLELIDDVEDMLLLSK